MFVLSGRIIIVFGVICYLVGQSIFIGVKKKKQVVWIKEVIKFLFVLYIFMVVSVTLFPLALGFQFKIENVYRSINFIPLVSIIKSISQIGIAYGGDVQFMIGLIVRNVGGNILLLMPLGFLAPIVLNTCNKFKHIALLGLFISISIECIQFIELILGVGFGRAVDIDDVICNVIGASFGYLIYKMLFQLADTFQMKFLKNMDQEKMKM